MKNRNATIDMLTAMFTLQAFADFHGTHAYIDPETGNTSEYNPGQPDANGIYQGTVGISASMLEYYTRIIIREAQPNLVHEQFGDDAPIPQKNGERAKWNRRKKLPKALKPLVEGVTPDPGKMTMVPIYADVYQYGYWLGYTDKVSWVMADPIIQEMSIALSEQYGITMDTVVREVINGGTNYRFAKKNAGTDKEEAIHTRAQIDRTCILTVNDVFRMNAILKANNVPKKGEYYVAIAHPYVINDLMMNAPDKMWTKVMAYAKPENIFKGEVGELGGFRFVSTSEAKIFKAPLTENHETLTVKTAATKGATEIAISEVLTDKEQEELVGYYINVGGVRYEINGVEASKLILAEGLENELKVGDELYSGETGLDGSPVFSTLFMGGKDTYGVTSIGGAKVEFIAKQLGQSGEDRLNQRGSVGWKATRGAVIINQENLIRFESGSSMEDEITSAN